MKKEVILSGFGGQGVMSIGKNLVEAAVAEDLEASWVPSYGPEMRGGTANCTVIISDERIGAPLVENPTEVIAMNRAALAKFEGSAAPGGTVFVNSSIVPDKVRRDDVKAVYVPCDEIAAELGNAKVLKPETIEHMIQEMFTGAKAKLVPLNLEALHRGMACGAPA